MAGSAPRPPPATRYAFRGYASTAAKHEIAIFAAIRDALAGDPWIPPIQMTERLAADIRHYIDVRGLELVRFAKGQSKDQVSRSAWPV